VNCDVHAMQLDRIRMTEKKLIHGLSSASPVVIVVDHDPASAHDLFVEKLEAALD
jgi:hypothetical protein